ncbi:MAG: peroxiredoxin [Paracoccaceae bacterium]
MTISEGMALPAATFQTKGESGAETVDLAAFTKGRKVVIFGLPGAYTGVCTTAHVPSFIRTRAAFADKGVDAIACISVNDIHVMKAWGDETGAIAAGIRMLSDGDGSFTRAIGLNFDAPPAGMYGRSKRYAAYVVDGVVKVLHLEESPGQCTISGGEALLEAI